MFLCFFCSSGGAISTVFPRAAVSRHVVLDVVVVVIYVFVFPHCITCTQTPLETPPRLPRASRQTLLGSNTHTQLSAAISHTHSPLFPPPTPRTRGPHTHPFLPLTERAWSSRGDGSQWRGPIMHVASARASRRLGLGSESRSG